MSALTVEQMNDASQWDAFEADGVTPSTELAIQDDATIHGYGTDGVSGRITATAVAAGHVLRRTIAPLDVSDATELRLSLRSSRTADRVGAAFFLELRMGSAALPVDDPGNAWHRLLPFTRAQRWESVRLGIEDLDPAVAGSLSQLQLRCIDADPPFTAHVDDVTAVRPQLLADADQALAQRLSGISVGGTVVLVAVRALAENAPGAPALDLTHADVRYAHARVRDVVLAQDFTTGGGVRLVPLGVPYDLEYVLTPIATSRADQVLLLEETIARLAPLDELHFHGERLPVEMTWPAGPERAGGAPTGDPVLFFRVGSRARVTRPTHMHHAVDELIAETGHLEEAP